MLANSTMDGGDVGGRYESFFEKIEDALEKLSIKFTDQQDKMWPMMAIRFPPSWGDG